MPSFSLKAAVPLVGLGFVIGLLCGGGRTRLEPQPVAATPAATVARGQAYARATSVAARDASEPPVPGARDPAVPSPGDPFLLIGVISAPTSFERRQMLRDFAVASAGSASERPVRTEFVFGDRLFTGTVPVDAQQRLADEARRHGDVVFVDARERLPHVGKATEKSAAWWLSAPKRSGARFFCKTDDDSLIHHQHLAAALATAEQQAKSPHIIFSYMRWRGWLPFHRYQACGGGWGGPIDAIRHIEDPETHCELAEGPFPQGTGQLTCLSRPLALALARNIEFERFQRVAMVRNDFGTPCDKADECAKHPFGLHMWHHEDAGISYNVWRTASERRLNVSLVHMPEKGWIWPWFSPKIAAPRQSARAILMHKVTPQLLPEVTSTWRVRKPAPPDLYVDCSQSCTQWGWKYARLPCEAPPPLSVARSDGRGWRGFGVPWNGSLCKHDPVAELGWRCCFLNTRDDRD